MANTVPIVMHRAFFTCYSNSGAFRISAATKVTEFIASVVSCPKLIAEAKGLLEHRLFSKTRFEKVLVAFLETPTYWQVTSDPVGPTAFQIVKVSETLIEKSEEPVFELEVGSIASGKYVRLPNPTLEWFGKRDMGHVLWAIEEKLKIPTYMWTGLATCGDNSEG